jgi:hypothetical protein
MMIYIWFAAATSGPIDNFVIPVILQMAVSEISIS